MSSRTPAPSYLIVCFRFLGDVLVTTPLALSIKTAYPDAVVDYLVFKGTEKVLAKNPYVRNVITIPRDTSGLSILLSLFRKYDVAIAAYPSDRTVLAASIIGKRSFGLIYGHKKGWWQHLVLSRHQICSDRIHVVSNILLLTGKLGIEPIPRVVMGYGDNDSAFARNAVPFDRYVIMHPYSMKEYKYWPAEKWAALALLIQNQFGAKVIFTKTPEPEGATLLAQIQKCDPLNINVFDSPCSLNELAAIIKGAVAFVGIDTAVTHIAAALDTPTLAIFGPTLTRYWSPWPNGSLTDSPFLENKGVQRNNYITVVQKNWPCVPCNQETCRISSRSEIECLAELTAEEVYEELSSLIKKHAMH